MRKAIVAIAAVCALAVPAREALGWGRGHKLIRKWAVEKLPAWQLEFVGAEHLANLYRKYTSIQDAHAGGNSPQYDRYCIIPGVSVSLHDVGAPRPSMRAIQWYIYNVIRELKAGNKDEAMKFLGVLCHWNEDPLSPTAHGSPASDALLRQLVPPPKDKENFNYILGYGGIGDVGNYTIPDEPYTPKLLGATIPEAAARIYQAQKRLRFRVASAFIPIIQSTMYGDGSKADEERAKAALRNAKFIADILYTVFCLAADKIDAGESAKLRTSRLTEWVSDSLGTRAGHPYYVVPFLTNQAMDAQRNLHPLAFAGSDGKVEFGYGTGTPSNIRFSIPSGGVFSSFTCRAGLHPTAGPKGKVHFSVRVNGKTAWEKTLASGDAPETVSVPLPATEVISLALVTEAVGGSPPLHNLVVWGEPTLHRSETPPPAYDPKAAPATPAKGPGAPEAKLPPVSSAKGKNLLKNSSLEEWIDDRTPVGFKPMKTGGSFVSKESGEFHSGKHCAKFTVDDAGSLIMMGAVFESSPGKRYRLRFFWKSPTGFIQYAVRRHGGTGWLAFNGTGWIQSNFNILSTGGTEGWNEQAIEFDGYEEPIKVRVDVCRPAGKGSGYSFYVDDITLEELE